MSERATRGSSASADARVVDPLDASHLGPESLRRYLAANRLSPNRRYSQNFLADASVLEAIVTAAALDAPRQPIASAARLGPDARQVLEIGPGIGILTGALLAAGANVVAVEVDPRMVDHLGRRFADAIADTTLRLVHDDILERAVGDLVAPPWDLVANVPYHITSPILHHVLSDEPRPDRFVLMVQREVAERIAAPPGGMSYISVFVQYHADVSILQVVPASSFEPAPEVDSAVLVGRTRARRLDAEGEETLWRVVQAGFRERRKMLHNVLPRQLPWLGRERIEAALLACDIAPDRRPQTLSVEAWMALAAALGPLDAAASPAPHQAAGGRP
ncbi:MAG TPA: 16S rRNA (adenine(1518)-N(6)/adenine(1519)-N(6))-dimethyltransferase RsmA [Candidatus Limnocylindrales bacterium]|jgi:16S rRNA (adenine1518-N6/adenine1519-N6)-dimethyltransferase